MKWAAGLASLGDPAGTATAGGMEVRWWFDGPAVVVSLDGPTLGWVAVGFVEGEVLDGSRLLLAAVTPTGPRAEEHAARPPNHPFVRSLVIRASEEGEGRTRMLVEVPAAAASGGAMTLRAGARCGLTVAWSQHDDFSHHSAYRTMVPIVL